ncbi:MAG: tetratricopeptide repeat protein [Saprospiraceae bacterium]
MKKENHIKQLKDLIAKNDLATVLKHLQELLNDTPQLDDVLHQSGRFQAIRKQIQLGTVSHENATLTQNQIRIGLLELIDEIEIQQEQNPAIKEEWGNAISISNSKNTISNSTITAGGDVNTGDTTITNITNITEQENQLPKHLTSNFPKIDPDNFVGRKETLQQLHQLLQDDKKTLLLNGLGGIGKTSVAQMYCHLHKNDYDHFVWLGQADNFENTCLNAIGLQKNLGVQLTDKTKEVVQDIFHELKKIKGNNLLILDNADHSLQDYTELLPPMWKVLVTSREKMDTRYFEYRLDTLDFPEAKLLFAKHFKKNSFTDEDLKKLCERIGYHTLTLELLAKTLQESFELNTLTDLLGFLENNKLNAADLQEEVFTNHSKEEVEIYTHLLQAFTLAGLEEEEKWLLLQFAVLPPILHEASDILDWIKVEDKKVYGKLLKDLNKKGWLERKDNAFILHRLVQIIIQSQIKPTYENCKGLVDTFIDFLFLDQDKDNPIDKFQWIEYGVNICESIKDNHGQIARLNNWTAYAFEIKADYTEAVKYYQEAILMVEFVGMKNKINTYNNNLANLYRQMGRYDKASELLEITLASDIKNLKEGHPEIAIRQSNLGLVYSQMGKYKEALELFETALASAKENFGKRHLSVGIRLNNLAELYVLTKNYEKARDHFEESYLILLENVGEDHPYVASCQSNLANLYRKMGRYEEASELLDKALAYDRKNLGEDHPKVAIRINNLALVYLDTKEYEKAKNHFEKSYLILLNNFGEDHPHIKQVKVNLEHTKQFLQ